MEINLEKKIKEESNISGIEEIKIFSTPLNPHMATVVSEGDSNVVKYVPSFARWIPVVRITSVIVDKAATFYDLNLFVYDAEGSKLKNELLVIKIDDTLTINDAKTRAEEIREQLTNNKINHLYYKQLMNSTRIFTIPAQGNPEDYLKPFDIVKRNVHVAPIISHAAIYLGQGKVCHIIPSDGSIFVNVHSWQKFLRGDDDEAKLGKRLFGENDLSAECYRPVINLKSPQLIINHIKKSLENDYGKGNYNLVVENCEHFANLIVYGIPHSDQVDSWLKKINNNLSPLWPSGYVINFATSIFELSEEKRIKKVLELGEKFFDDLEKKRELNNEEEEIFNKLQAQIQVAPKDKYFFDS